MCWPGSTWAVLPSPRASLMLFIALLGHFTLAFGLLSALHGGVLNSEPSAGRPLAGFVLSDLGSVPNLSSLAPSFLVTLQSRLRGSRASSTLPPSNPNSDPSLCSLPPCLPQSPSSGKTSGVTCCRPPSRPLPCCQKGGAASQVCLPSPCFQPIALGNRPDQDPKTLVQHCSNTEREMGLRMNPGQTKNSCDCAFFFFETHHKSSA